MKCPIPWLLDYLDLRGAELSMVLADACKRWDLAPAADPARTLGTLFTFAGFACDAVEGAGVEAVLELDVLSNRPDCLCILGLAREASAFLRVGLKLPPCDLAESNERVDAAAAVAVQDSAGCPRYTARVIHGVKVGPSPEWLRKRLISMGLTPRNNIVDITNFVLFELNQPLHAFDLQRLAGQRIVVRRAQDREAFKPLYGEIPALTPETLVIADAERPVAIGGVIGGMGSEVSTETTTILLESACFDTVNTRRTSRRLKVSTDSSYRFERGVDMESVERASARAARLMVELAGGKVARGVIDSNPQLRPPLEILLRNARLRSLYGAEVPPATIRELLLALGCTILRATPDETLIQIPSWRRTDLAREVDLIEEIARLHGYNHVPAATDMPAQIPAHAPLEIATGRVRELFTALGYFECVTDSLIEPRWPVPAIWTKAAPLAMDPASVLREDHSALRNSLAVSLLNVCRLNQDRRTGMVRIFETGRVFLPKTGTPSPDERPVLGLLDGQGFASLSDALLRLDEMLELDGAHLKLRPPAPGQTPDFLTPETACRVIRVRGAEGAERAEDAIGWIGVVSPSLCRAFDLKRPPALAEIDLAALAALPHAPRRYTPLPSQPEVVRDIAMVVDDRVAWDEIEGFAARYAKAEPMRDRSERPRFLSVFRGKQAGPGKKSVAFSVVYRAAERSLTDEEVNAAHGKFVEELLKQFKATLRA